MKYQVIESNGPIRRNTFNELKTGKQWYDDFIIEINGIIDTLATYDDRMAYIPTELVIDAAKRISGNTDE